MRTIIKIAWRNVWRNKLRSTVVISAIALGLWAGLFMMAMVLGLNEQRMNGAVNSYLSHIQIHHPKYLETPKVKYTLEEGHIAKDILAKDKRIKAFSERVSTTAMVANSSGSYGVQLLGIDPKKEKTLTSISTQLTDGSYFGESKKNPILVGEKLAKKLKLKIKSKIIVTFQDVEQNMVAIAFKVVGIYKTSSSNFDEATLFAQKEDLHQHLGIEQGIHEIVAICNSIEDVDQVKNNLTTAIKKDKVETWMEVAPDLGYAQNMMSQMVYIFMLIILLALSFSIINTMLMAVLERKKEIGMLMSIGMNKLNLFAMIAYETIFISMIATPIGMSLAFLTISYFGSHGINFSSISEGLESLGVGAIVYPFLPTNLYINITLMTLLVAFLSSLFPARRALKLNPTEAVRAL